MIKSCVYYKGNIINKYKYIFLYSLKIELSQNKGRSHPERVLTHVGKVQEDV